MSSEPLLSADEPGAIAVSNVSKRFTVYNRPIDRVREMGSLGFKRYGRDFWAVRNVSFAIRRGETVGLLGINGAGKSTILQMICGTLAPTEGRIETNGRISALLELGAGFSPEFTGRENVFLNGRILGMTEAEVEGCLGHIADFAGIGEFIDRPVRTYSSGMFVRLAFAVATNLNPDILIIDEALAVGDTAFQQRCYSHLRTRLGHATKLFVTHDLATLATMTERVIVLDGGRLAFDGATAEALRFYTDLTRQGTQVTLSRNHGTEPAPGLLPYETDLGSDPALSAKEAAMVPVDPASTTGRGEISITDMAFLVDGYSGLAIAPGDMATALIRIRSSRPVAVPGAVSFVVSDRRGQAVFGQDTSSCVTGDVLIRPGTSLAEFSFTWPSLKSDDYTVSFGVRECEPGNPTVHEVQCWAADAIHIRAANTRRVNEIFSVPINDFAMGIAVSAHHGRPPVPHGASA